MSKLTLALLAMSVASAGSAAEAPQALRVFFTVAPAPAPQPDPKAYAQKLERERDAAWAEYDAAFKELKKKYGKDYEKWTAEQKDEAQRVYEKYVAKAIEYLFFTIKPKDLEDSLRDIKNSVVGKGLAGVKENIVLAESETDADLVLEALGRYGASKLVVGPKHFVFRFRTGGRLKPEALSAVPHDWPRPTWWADEKCSQYHYYRPEEPWIVWKAVDDQRWRDVMNTTSACINDLAKQHGANILAMGH
jgi:Skp family chaperone for outer membrane proteins